MSGREVDRGEHPNAVLQDDRLQEGPFGLDLAPRLLRSEVPRLRGTLRRDITSPLRREAYLASRHVPLHTRFLVN